MPRFYLSDSDDQRSSTTKLSGRRRSLHHLLGGGKVANILLWRNKRLSAAILFGATVMWLLFEVVEYHFITLLCHISIIAMLAVFISSNAAFLLGRNNLKIPEINLSERTFKEFAVAFHVKLSRFLFVLHDIAQGKDFKLLILAIASLWIISVIGSYCSALDLLYFGFLCIHTLPVLYEQYGREVDHLATMGSRDLKKLFGKFDSKVLNKIPRGPVKEKKFK